MLDIAVNAPTVSEHHLLRCIIDGQVNSTIHQVAGLLIGIFVLQQQRPLHKPELGKQSLSAINQGFKRYFLRLIFVAAITMFLKHREYLWVMIR